MGKTEHQWIYWKWFFAVGASNNEWRSNLLYTWIFFFFISSNNCPQVSKLFIVQIHSKKNHCHYLIQRQFGGLNTFVKVIANEETPVLALFHPMERSSVTVPNCQKSCKLPLLIIEPPTRRNIVSMPLKVICDVCVCILLSNAYCFVNTE